MERANNVISEAADIGKLRPRWDGPFTVLPRPSSNAYTLALPRRKHCSAVKVDHLKPLFERFGPPGPGPGTEGEVEPLLNHPRARRATHYLVLWRGHKSAEGRLREEEAAAFHCRDKVAEYDAVASRAVRSPGPSSLLILRWRTAVAACRGAAAATRRRRLHPPPPPPAAAPPPPYHHRRFATTCHPTAGGCSGGLSAADSPRVVHGPRLTEPDGAVLLAWRRLVQQGYRKYSRCCVNNYILIKG